MICPVFLPHLGCRERCSYCDQQSITNSDRNNLQETIKKSLGSHEGTYEVGLFGGNIFGIEPPLLEKLFSSFSDYRDRISNFRISTKPVPLDDRVLEILKQNNVTVIELGIPLFNNEILKNLNRDHTVEDFYLTYERLKSMGFNVALQVMVGLPGETFTEIKKSADNIVRLNPHYIRIYPLAIMKGTPIHRLYEAKEFIPIPFEEAVLRAVYIYLNAMAHNIGVVKMGLTDNEIIKERIVAGFYHPAFGSIVKSECYYLALRSVIDKAGLKNHVTVRLNKKDIPHLIGHKRNNIERLQRQGIYVSWEVWQIKQGSFILYKDNKEVEGDIFDALYFFRKVLKGD